MSFNTFRKRMNVKGGTLYDRRMNSAIRDFKIWFEGALGRELVSIDGIEQYAVFQDQNQNNNKDLSDDKYIIVENESNIKVGSYIKWRDKTWMVFTEEHKTIPTHKQAKVKESNHIIKWMIGRDVCNGGHGFEAFIQNQTLYTLGVSTSGNHAWIVNAKMMMYLPDNDETRHVKIGQRIVIGGAIYQVMFKDYVSREGLINYLLEQDMVSSRDNLELGIADYYVFDDGENSDTTPIPPTDKELIISGDERARIGSLIKYEASFFANGSPDPEEVVSEWIVADVESSVVVEEQTEKSITIRVVNNFQKVGSVINIIGKTSNGTIGSKTVRIVSPY